jgi:hypothetical protein
VNFETQINISAPVLYFGACQYRLSWDPYLFRIMDAWTITNGAGSAYNGSVWKASDTLGLGRTGDQNCANGRPKLEDGKGGCANFVTGWTDQIFGGEGMNISVPPKGPAEAKFITIRWRTSGPGCWGTTANTGVSNLEFIPLGSDGNPTLICGGMHLGAVVDYEAVGMYEFNWINTSVTVK